jgi:hypothetical protein
MAGLFSNSVAFTQNALRARQIADRNTRRGTHVHPDDPDAIRRMEAIYAAREPEGRVTNQDLLRQPGVEDVIPNVGTSSQLGGNSTMILSARGTFYQIRLAETYGPGVYAIDELTRGQDQPLGEGQTSFLLRSPILLNSIEFNQTDIVSPMPCLDNVKVFYSFGQNFGQAVISGEVLLGPLGNISYDGVDRLVDFFWKNRVSVTHRPIAVSVANNPYFVYLTGLRIGRVDSEFHILPFAMFGTLLDLNREETNVVNVRGRVVTGGSLDEPSLYAALMDRPDTQSPPADDVESKQAQAVVEEIEQTLQQRHGPEGLPEDSEAADNSPLVEREFHLLSQPDTPLSIKPPAQGRVIQLDPPPTSPANVNQFGIR